MSFHPFHLILILLALLAGAMWMAAHHSRRLKELAERSAAREHVQTTAERLATLELEIARARDR